MENKDKMLPYVYPYDNKKNVGLKFFFLNEQQHIFIVKLITRVLEGS